MVKLVREVTARVKRFKELLAVSGIAAALVTRKSDVRYFSGFTGDDSCLLLTKRQDYLITDGRYVEEAKNTTRLYEVVTWKDHPAAFAAELLPGTIKKIGICDNHLTVHWHKKLLGAGLNTVPLDSVIANIREQKSAWEVDKIRDSLKAVESAFREFKSRIKVGMTEKELKLELEFLMYRQGVEAPSFDTIVAEGENASLPHAHAGERCIAQGSILLIDFGGIIDGYCSDLTRTLFIGDVSDQWRERYELVLQAQQAGMAVIKAGAETKSSDIAAREVFAAAGVEENYLHSLGHGVGMDIHELPRLSKKAAGKLPAGAVVTVEPGLYYPGFGGIRIEDMVLVERSGVRVLSTLEKDLESAVVN